MLTNFNMHGCGFLFLFALLSKLIILNVTINYILESVELVELFDWILHELEESTTKVSKLRKDFKPQVVRLGSD
jgi:hypothetical protein